MRIWEVAKKALSPLLCPGEYLAKMPTNEMPIAVKQRGFRGWT
jgi:hypothetical protein